MPGPSSLWGIRNIRHAATLQVSGLNLWRMLFLLRIGAAARGRGGTYGGWRQTTLRRVGVADSANMWRVPEEPSATDSPPLTCGVADVADAWGLGRQ